MFRRPVTVFRSFRSWGLPPSYSNSDPHIIARPRMGPSRLLWFVFGAGVGAWVASRARVKVDWRVERTFAPPVSGDPSMQTNTTELPMRETRMWQATSRYTSDFEQERERVKQSAESTGDAIAELSEATLSTIIQATEALKAKMAEHRALREEERRIQEEERRRNPPHLV
ncbi:hypothetical protein B0H15DRAFT_822161 [Mycena belliarum]|uniref:Uncharacterized protein n=1 Tax=Mycena belliarum TaxID=1033014 RepID=A0AAD6UH98_9AGAR|nr:hypothetical protein B0H15DRAFT_822161 [Mycena belliae]